MGTNHRAGEHDSMRSKREEMATLPHFKRLIKDCGGDAVVEAVIIFPVMIMIFSALVLLAIYLPTRGALQRATQFAATAISTGISDTWLYIEDGKAAYRWETNKENLSNVYVSLFSGTGDIQARSEELVNVIEGSSLSSKAGILKVDSIIINRVIYKEVVVTATREFEAPVDLSFIRFPKTIHVTATSTAVVQNGDEFVRTLDMAADFVEFATEKFGLSYIAGSISSLGSRISELFGW